MYIEKKRETENERETERERARERDRQKERGERREKESDEYQEGKRKRLSESNNVSFIFGSVEGHRDAMMREY